MSGPAIRLVRGGPRAGAPGRMHPGATVRIEERP
ncbi:hypothetical protein SAMN05444858_114131 [Micromonospora avicenniae]|uniref:Uncharacterized protein n=1 Tax=Micromonospora avicenniae TaxID=1198245 RepID=A0A1N7CZS5_9ACTN|nr:hypothetical protein SAMN05444858_114131 [Micromonospora avicenniae]